MLRLFFFSKEYLIIQIDDNIVSLALSDQVNPHYARRQKNKIAIASPFFATDHKKYSHKIKAQTISRRQRFFGNQYQNEARIRNRSDPDPITVYKANASSLVSSG